MEECTYTTVFSVMTPTAAVRLAGWLLSKHFWFDVRHKRTHWEFETSGGLTQLDLPDNLSGDVEIARSDNRLAKLKV